MKSVPQKSFNVRDFGATGDGVTDDTDLLAEIVRLKKIVGCVVRTIDRMDYGLDSVIETVRRSQCESIDPDPLCGSTWGKVGYMCGLGSTSARQLCREFEVDPDHNQRRDQ